MEEDAVTEPRTGKEPDSPPVEPISLEAIARRVRELESEWREMIIEWESMFEKFRNLYARLNKRDSREEARNSPAPQPISPLALALLQSARRPEE